MERRPIVCPKASALRSVNAVCLQNAVLCDCDCVSDSPHDKCLACGSRSLFNIARVLGGNLSRNRAALIEAKSVEPSLLEGVLRFPRFHRISPEGRRLVSNRQREIGTPDFPIPINLAATDIPVDNFTVLICLARACQLSQQHVVWRNSLLVCLGATATRVAIRTIPAAHADPVLPLPAPAFL